MTQETKYRRFDGVRGESLPYYVVQAMAKEGMRPLTMSEFMRFRLESENNPTLNDLLIKPGSSYRGYKLASLCIHEDSDIITIVPNATRYMECQPGGIVLPGRNSSFKLKAVLDDYIENRNGSWGGDLRRSFQGYEFSREKLKNTLNRNHLTLEEARVHPILQVLAEDGNLLNEYLQLTNKGGKCFEISTSVNDPDDLTYGLVNVIEILESTDRLYFYLGGNHPNVTRMIGKSIGEIRK